MSSRSHKDVWMDAKAEPAARLVAFHAWLSLRIAALFHIPQSDQKLIAQMRAETLKSVRVLNERGWLLDGTALADHLESQFSAIRKHHVGGRINDLYIYWRRSWDAYVRVQADEIRAKAMSLGMHISNYQSLYKPSIPELEAERHQESLRERLQKVRKQSARKPVDTNQQTLFS